MDADISGEVYMWYAIATLLALVPLVAMLVHFLRSGGVLQGGWVARVILTIVWSLLTFGAIIVGLPDSVIIFAFILGMVMIVRAYTPLVEAVHLARRADRDAAWWRHVRQ